MFHIVYKFPFNEVLLVNIQ